MSIGLLANPAFGEGRRAVVMVFASPSGQFHRDKKNLHIYRDFAKTHANPDTPRCRSGQAHGNSLNRRAVRLHST